MGESTYRVVPAVDKAARLLAQLQPGDSLGISELARRIDASKGTVRDILLTLASHGLVRRTAEGRFHRADVPELLELARPVLASLMEAFDETAILGVITDGQLEIAARAEPKTELHVSAQIGRRLRLHAGAHGKVITGRAPVGYDDEELFPGVRAAAAPVIGPDGRPVGVLLVVGFKERLDMRTLRRIGERCAQEARALSLRLGAQGDLASERVARASGDKGKVVA